MSICLQFWYISYLCNIRVLLFSGNFSTRCLIMRMHTNTVAAPACSGWCCIWIKAFHEFDYFFSIPRQCCLIESNSYLLFDSIRNWRNYSKFSNSYLTVISRVTETRFVCTLPATSRCTHMSLNPVLLRMCAYPSHFPFRNWSSHLRKNEYNIPTFENGKNYSIWFEISNNSLIFNLIRFEMKKHYSHSTNRLLPVFSNKWLIDWLIKGTSHPQSVTTVELVLLAGQLKIITTGAATVT